jgi:Tfp pilus assembly protein PilW
MPRKKKESNSGFTLIEFAVCNLATLVMFAATFSLLNTIFTANSGMGEVKDTQQNVRVAMNTIARDITTAGTGLPNGGIAVPNGTNSTTLTRMGAGGTLSTPNNVIALLTPGNAGGPTVGGGVVNTLLTSGLATDVLTITSINQDSPTWNALTISSDGTQIDFVQEVRSGANQLFVGDLLVVTNSLGSVFGCVTSVSSTTSRAFFATADLMGINQPTAAAGNIKSLRSGGVYPPTTLTRVNIVNYYINNSVAAHPKLMRATNAQTPQVIVEDIENLQFAFDLFDFTNNVDTANQATTTSPNQIRSVNVAISGRSPQVMQRSGKYYRFSLVSKVNVRNATFRNRYTGT